MYSRVDKLREHLFALENQMIRIYDARERKEIGRKKYIIVQDAVLDIELKTLYDLESTYSRMETSGCFK